MPRQAPDLEGKARRLLGDGRLTVLRINPSGFVRATCKGDSGIVYDLGFDPGPKEWRCTCAAFKTFHRRCSHVVALQLVTTKIGDT